MSLTTDGPQGARLPIPPTATLPSFLWSLRIFPSLSGSRLTNFYREASSALLHLVNQCLNFTYSRSHALHYGRQNTRPDFVKNRTHDFCSSSGLRGYHYNTRATSLEKTDCRSAVALIVTSTLCCYQRPLYPPELYKRGVAVHALRAQDRALKKYALRCISNKTRAVEILCASPFRMSFASSLENHARHQITQNMLLWGQYKDGVVIFFMHLERTAIFWDAPQRQPCPRCGKVGTPPLRKTWDRKCLEVTRE